MIDLCAILAVVPVVRDPDLSVEARQRLIDGCDSIVLGPKFFKLDCGAQRWIMAHEAGHWIASRIGFSNWIKAAEEAGLDVWDNLPWGTHNSEEAFAETFVVLMLTPEEHRHLDWQRFVRAIVVRWQREGE